MKTQISIFLMLVLTACGSAPKKEEAKQGDFVYTYKTFGNPSDKRVILTHGIWDTDSLYDSGNFKALKDAFIAKGFQVITFSYPYTISIFGDKGEKYRNDYLAFVSWLVQDTNEKFGAPTRLIIGGFSFGGLHAMIAASAIPAINEFLAMSPVVDPRKSGLFGAVITDFFNAENETAALANKRGIIVGNMDDSILSESRMRMIAHAIGVSCSYFGFYSGGHDLTNEGLAAISDWI